MPITDILVENAKLYGDEVALVETNPYKMYRREITWKEFNDQSNSFAHMLLHDGTVKGDKVAILMMNCLEWLPIYFGVLKTGAVVVPMNFRYSADEIKY
ncbi:MAG: acyl--CoA ligase, partial [Coriobacteriales bacterium]|nr:acyl--CoA ligase [Coriobacteriales bacterium]